MLASPTCLPYSPGENRTVSITPLRITIKSCKEMSDELINQKKISCDQLYYFTLY